jgi:predicted Fe-Mo cluster-binding NifX family protein
MKVCLSSTIDNLEGQLDPRFGRCAYLLIVDTETLEYEAISNSAANATGGAGIQAAQTIANKGVKAVLTGNVGPNAFRALSAAGIEILTGASGSLKKVLEDFKNGKLSKTFSPTVSGHSGGQPMQGQKP